jgi:hypothetical protein
MRWARRVHGKQGCCRMISRNGNLMSRFAGLGAQIAPHSM